MTHSQAPFQPKEPTSEFAAQFMFDSLVQAAPYKIFAPSVPVKLDQNESPFDWPQELKTKVTDKLLKMSWNRYPPDFADDLAAKLADYAGVPSENVLLGPGSNYLCSIVLSLFSQKIPGKMYVARPSFALYESHCKYYGIPYEPWELDKDLQYVPDQLDNMPKGSVVIFASPNNPVGNSLSKSDFQSLLERHPNSLFLADEAYYEFAEEPYTDLLKRHSNLILIRTFSKSLGCAGVRIGYLMGATRYLEQIRKLRLPYLLNHFSLAAGETILTDPQIKRTLLANVEQTKKDRDHVAAELERIGAKHFTVIPSQANFLLLRCHDESFKTKLQNDLVSHGILIRDVSKGPGLAGCLRLTIGNTEENTKFLQALAKILATTLGAQRS